MSEQSTKEMKLGPIGSRVLFENDLVRIWEVELEPGQHQGYHHHSLPYVVVSVGESNNKIMSIDGTARYTDEPVGHFVYMDAGQTHDLENVGTTRYRNRLIEIKVPVNEEGS